MKNLTILTIGALALAPCNVFSQGIYGVNSYVEGGTGIILKAWIAYRDTTVGESRTYVLVDWGDGTGLDTLHGGSLGSDARGSLCIFYGNHDYASYGTYTIEIFDSIRASGIHNMPPPADAGFCHKRTVVLNGYYNTSPGCGGWSSEREYVISMGTAGDSVDFGYTIVCLDLEGNPRDYELVPPACVDTSEYTYPPGMRMDNGIMTMAIPDSDYSYAFAMKVTEYMLDGVTYIGEGIFEFVVTFENVLSAIQNPSGQSSLAVYPNPSDGIVYFSSLDRTTRIRVCDANGREVEYHRMGNAIDLSHLAPGLYLVQIVSESFTETAKIILQ